MNSSRSEGVRSCQCFPSAPLAISGQSNIRSATFRTAICLSDAERSLALDTSRYISSTWPRIWSVGPFATAVDASNKDTRTSVVATARTTPLAFMITILASHSEQDGDHESQRRCPRGRHHTRLEQRYEDECGGDREDNAVGFHDHHPVRSARPGLSA